MVEAIEQYDKIGARYRGFKDNATLPIPEKEHIEALLGELHGARVLDLACGFGFYSRLSRRLGAKEVLGVDVSAEMVRNAQADAPDGVSFQVQDAAALPKLGDFDVVTAVWLFNYALSTRKLSAMVEGIARNLVPGGRLIAMTVDPAYDIDGASLRTYGFDATLIQRHPDGDEMDAQLIGPEGGLPIHIFRWNTSVYERAMENAGLEEWAWIPTPVPAAELESRGTAYWENYLKNPFVTALVAQK